MRADRLVATLLVLQARGQVTAAELAEELEVSERTARRDLEALAMAGVPVYSQRGRGGGWTLLGGARTDLSGLNANEAKALFLVAGPSSSATPEVKAALRKLVRALPATFRPAAEAATGAVVIDPAGWGRVAAAAPTPFLDPLRHAVVDGKVAVLGYRDRSGATTERPVHPLGLVAKGGAWYVVAMTDKGRRTFRVDRVTSVTVTDAPVKRPNDFDLAAVWQEIEATVEERRTPARCRLVTTAAMVPRLRAEFAKRLTVVEDRGDHALCELRGYNPFILAVELAGYGSYLEVTEPDDVRAHLAEIGAALVATYR